MGQTAVNKRCLLIIIGIFVVAALIVAIAVPLSLQANDSDDGDSSSTKSQSWAVDCYPEAEGNGALIDERTCEERGCQFNPSPQPNLPVCSHREGKYRISVTTEQDNKEQGLLAKLSQVGSAPFGGDIKEWDFTIKAHGDNVLRFSFVPSQKERYRVPIELNLGQESNPQADTSGFQFLFTNRENLGFKILRKSTGTTIWETPSVAGGLVLSDQFLQIMTLLPSSYVYGLGEQSHNSFLHEFNKTWPAFARDQPPPWSEGANLYGVHPFYTCVEDAKGNTHGIFLLNSNAQEYSLNSMPSLTFRTIGGVLDFFVFLGPSPEEVVQQYTGVIGHPMMPPYWALGFQLCRYGYNNISNLKEAVDSTKRYAIPHDIQYVDIDHMDTRNTFTVDEENFPDLNGYFQSLRDGGMRIIYILDPCMISNTSDYLPYQKMAEIDGNIKWVNSSVVPSNYSDENGAILGYVWPQGPVAFPDYFKEKTQEVWHDLIVNHSKTLVFDGLWIDMNEPASFGTNEDRPFNWPEDLRPYFSLQCPTGPLEDPPYRTKAAYMWDQRTGPAQRRARLSDKTICLDTVQGDRGQYKHYNVHNLYGWSQSEPTLRAARSATDERSVVISRSTYPSSGRYVGHWLGDNASQWKEMRRSIIGMLEFNLFGIPYVGADICGFFGNTTVSLCKRWMQLGAFYPFSRNHNSIDMLKQGPGQMGDELGEASRAILEVRYRLLPYLYLLFHQAHTEGSTVIRPLHHEFPQDMNVRSIDRQFMWGSCLLISPILDENQKDLNYYLPSGRWYDLLSDEKYSVKDLDKGREQSVPVKEADMPRVHLRGGCALTLQGHANNTHFSRKQPLEVMVALDMNGMATGQFFWDDGVSIVDAETYKYYMAEIKVEQNSLSWLVTKDPGQQEWTDLSIQNVTILGVPGTVTSVQLFVVPDSQPNNKTFSQTEQALTVDLSVQGILQNFTLTWS